MAALCNHIKYRPSALVIGQRAVILGLWLHTPGFGSVLSLTYNTQTVPRRVRGMGREISMARTCGFADILVSQLGTTVLVSIGAKLATPSNGKKSDWTTKGFLHYGWRSTRIFLYAPMNSEVSHCRFPYKRQEARIFLFDDLTL